MFYLRGLQLARRTTRYISCMQLKVSQRKSAIFVLSSIVAMSLADKLLLHKKNDGYGFHEENTGDTKVFNFGTYPTQLGTENNSNF